MRKYVCQLSVFSDRCEIELHHRCRRFLRRQHVDVGPPQSPIRPRQSGRDKIRVARFRIVVVADISGSHDIRVVSVRKHRIPSARSYGSVSIPKDEEFRPTRRGLFKSSHCNQIASSHRADVLEAEASEQVTRNENGQDNDG